MPDGTTSVSGPTASHGVHLELDLALDNLLGSRIRTLICTGETARQAAPADLQDALEKIADDGPSDHRCDDSPPASPDVLTTPYAATRRRTVSP